MCVFVCFLSLTPGLTRQGVRAFLGEQDESIATLVVDNLDGYHLTQFR